MESTRVCSTGTQYNKDKTRMSWPVFLEPPPDLAIGPHSKLIKEENPLITRIP